MAPPCAPTATPRWGRATPRLALLAALVPALVAVACSKAEFEDRTAQVTIDGKASTFQVDSCGLDHQTLFVVGRTDGGRILQAVIGLRADDETGIPASSGLTVDLGEGRVAPAGQIGAFGRESWARQGQTGPAPGAVTSARLRGSRIQLSGTAVTLDAAGRPTDRPTEHRIALDARCDERDD